jgi:ubiquitin-protein ligase
MENLKSNHYFTAHGEINDKQISKETMKRIMREVTKTFPSQIDLNPRGTVFVRYDEVSPQYMRAIITGVQGSPYSSGIFIFDLYLPPEYPSVPPLVKHVTPRANEIQANNGPGGFSPNLHSESGQVCLSLLGTWEGPGWDPSSSNVYQVLSSILWMILAAPHPYYLEPGFGGWEGTAPTDIDKCPGPYRLSPFPDLSSRQAECARV